MTTTTSRPNVLTIDPSDLEELESKIAVQIESKTAAALHYPGAVRVLSSDSQQDVDDRQAVADRIYSSEIAAGASPQAAETAVVHAGFAVP